MAGGRDSTGRLLILLGQTGPDRIPPFSVAPTIHPSICPSSFILHSIHLLDHWKTEATGPKMEHGPQPAPAHHQRELSLPLILEDPSLATILVTETTSAPWPVPALFEGGLQQWKAGLLRGGGRAGVGCWIGGDLLRSARSQISGFLLPPWAQPPALPQWQLDLVARRRHALHHREPKPVFQRVEMGEGGAMKSGCGGAHEDPQVLLEVMVL